MITQADENYLKEIYSLSLDHERVTTSMLADHFNFSPATVTGMIKKLAAKKWVYHQPYRGVQLTEQGKNIALKVLRRHRLLETFLVETLKVPWDRVHQEAEHLEHGLSPYLEKKIDEFLGYPTQDPHGAPIPDQEGRIKQHARLRLTELSKGDEAEIIEISDRNPDLLTHMEKLKLYPRSQIKVLSYEPIDGLISILVNGQTLLLGPNSADQIQVRKKKPD